MNDTLPVSRVRAGPSSGGLGQYGLRLTRWPMLATGILGSWAVLWWGHADVTTATAAAWLVRASAAVVSVMVAFAFDDPSVDTTRALPSARGRLMRMRFGVGGATVVLALAPVVVTTWPYLDVASTVLGLFVEVLVLVVFTTSVTLGLQRHLGIREPAQFMILVVLVLLLAAQLLGQRWPLLVSPGPLWDEAHRRWVGALVVGLVVLGWQLRDPASAPLRRWLRPSR
jgi:hypothetical protein